MFYKCTNWKIFNKMLIVIYALENHMKILFCFTVHIYKSLVFICLLLEILLFIFAS